MSNLSRRDFAMRAGLTKAIAWLPLAAVVLMATAVAFALAQSSPGAPPQADNAENLAKQVANPIASPISVRFENNFDFNTGPEGDGYRYTMNFQPVIPIAVKALHDEDRLDLFARTRNRAMTGSQMPGQCRFT